MDERGMEILHHFGDEALPNASNVARPLHR
jgi:hypothetical protein